MQRVAGWYNRVVSTQWTGTVPSCARPTSVEESDLVKWLAPTGAKPMGHDDDDEILEQRVNVLDVSIVLMFSMCIAMIYELNL